MDKDFVIKDNVLIQYTGTNNIVTIPEGVEIIGNSVFLNNKKIEKVILPKSCKNIKAKAFLNCQNLKKINLENVTCIDNETFKNCESLKIINLKNVKNIEEKAFYNCKPVKIIFPKDIKNINIDLISTINLKEIVINGSTQYITMWLPMLAEGNCVDKITINNNEPDIFIYLLVSLNKVNKIEVNNPYLKEKDGMLYNAEETKLIWCPPMLDIEKYKIPDTTEEIGECSFGYNQIIKKIELGKNVKIISKYAFANSKIENIKFNNKLEKIEKDALLRTKCKEIDLSKTNIKILNLEKIGLNLNKNITQKVIIPDNIENLSTVNAKTKIYGNLFKKNYPIKIQEIEKINFKKSLEELLEEGKTFIEASTIIKEQER